MWALIWHDLHVDAVVYVYETEAEAKAGAVGHMIEYLRSTQRYDHFLMAEQLSTMTHDHAYAMMADPILHDATVDIDKLYWHVTEVRRG